MSFTDKGKIPPEASSSESVLKTLHTGLGLSINETVSMYNAARDPRQLLTFGPKDETFNKRMFNYRTKLKNIKNPGKQLEDRYKDEMKIGDEVSKVFKEKVFHYMAEPFYCTEDEAKAKSLKFVQERFKIEMEELDNKYGTNQDAALEYAKHKNTSDMDIGP